MPWKRFNYIQLMLYPVIASGGIIFALAWLVALLDLNWIFLQENKWAVNLLTIAIVIFIAICLGLFFYCYAQLMRLIVKNMSWEALESELKELKRNQ